MRQRRGIKTGLFLWGEKGIVFKTYLSTPSTPFCSSHPEKGTALGFTKMRYLVELSVIKGIPFPSFSQNQDDSFLF